MKMLWRCNLQTTASISIAVVLLAINTRCHTYPQTDAQRRKQFLKMLTSETPNSKQPEKDGDIRMLVDFDDVKKNVTQGVNLLELLIDGNKRNRKSNNEPPLVSEGETQLTPLKMMGKFKKTWCKTEPFMQVIKEPGCLKRRVLNRFCYGQCNSFYIPKTLRKRMKRKVFRSCGVCKPKRKHTIVVTLKCPGLKKGFKHKKVKQVKQCRCMER